MANQRIGFIDTYHASRLNHLTGTNYPATPAGNYLALYDGTLPLSDGSGGGEVTGTRPSVTLSGSPQTGESGRQYLTNTAAVSNISLANTTAKQVTGFGIFAAATGGSPIYIGRLYPFQIQPNATVTIPANSLRIYAETAFLN